MSERLYARRDTEALSKHYFRHVEAMTAEGLHSKAAIAAELAWRDARIAELGGARECGWVSVKDRLPAQDGYTGHVLVARTLRFDPQFGHRDVTMAYLAKDGWRNDHGPVLEEGEEVTHWMPIPDPPPVAKGEAKS